MERLRWYMQRKNTHLDPSNFIQIWLRDYATMIGYGRQVGGASLYASSASHTFSGI